MWSYFRLVRLDFQSPVSLEVLLQTPNSASVSSKISGSRSCTKWWNSENKFRVKDVHSDNFITEMESLDVVLRRYCICCRNMHVCIDAHLICCVRVVFT